MPPERPPVRLVTSRSSPCPAACWPFTGTRSTRPGPGLTRHIVLRVRPISRTWTGCRGANGQNLEVHYVYTATGPVVDKVTYQANAKVVPFAQVEQAATAKFGRPSIAFRAMSRTVQWCKKACDRGYTTPTNQDSLTLDGGVVGPIYLVLSDGMALQRSVKSSVEEAAAKLAGKGAKPAI